MFNIHNTKKLIVLPLDPRMENIITNNYGDTCNGEINFMIYLSIWIIYRDLTSRRGIPGYLSPNDLIPGE